MLAPGGRVAGVDGDDVVPGSLLEGPAPSAYRDIPRALVTRMRRATSGRGAVSL